MKFPNLHKSIIAIMLTSLGSASISQSNGDLSIQQLIATRIESNKGVTNLLQRRAAFERLMASMPSTGTTAGVEDTLGGVKGRWFGGDGKNRQRPVVLYLHGGGFYSGSSSTHRNVAVTLADTSKTDVFVADYRLSPEHKYPAQVEDTVSAFEALRGRGIPACSIAVASDSAGGWLAADLAVQLKEKSQDQPAALYLMSPILDFSGRSRSMQEKASVDTVVTPTGIRNSSVAAFGENPSILQARAWSADLRGLPPILIQVGSDETLLDDALGFAEKGARAGVPTRLRVYPGVMHQWQLFPGNFSPAREALMEAGAFLNSQFCR